jgi:pimeloyl-ACP methyl ester carboxylesterase
MAADTPAAPVAEFVRVPTADGALLTLKCRRNPGGVPVILVHGLAVNADVWDLPAVDTPECRFRSLASELHAAGHDVWMVNLRGHGAPHMLSTPPPGLADWCVDHFILYDLPAVVDHVTAATGARPFVVGSSMGAMTLAGYAQGATGVGSPALARIVADPAVAAARQAQLAGAVFIEFPAALRWPDSAYDETGQPVWRALLRDWWRSDADVNFPFEIAARWAWLEALIVAAGGVPLDRLRPSGRGEALLARLPVPLADAWRRAERGFVQAGLDLVGLLSGHAHYRAEVLLAGRRFVVDQMKAGVLQQMARSVRDRNFASLLGEPPHVYSDHYEQITLPLLVIAGGRDRIAHAGVTRDVFFDRCRAEDRTFLLFEDVSHGEFEAAPVATARVFPPLLEWLATRAGRSRG